MHLAERKNNSESKRLQEICDAQRFASPSELLGRVFAAVENFSRGREQQDAMAAALFHF
jgi:hypothetical protein